MNRQDVKIGEFYAVAVSRNDPKQGVFLGIAKNIEVDATSGKDATVIIESEDGCEGPVTTGQIKMKWTSYLAEEAQRHENEHILELGRRALAAERITLEQRTRDAGLNLVEDVRFTQGTMRVSVSFEIWEKFLEYYDGGK